MPAPKRKTTHLADTGYLLCFGAVPKGLDLLTAMFTGGLAAVPAVKAEIRNFAGGGRGRELEAAAGPYVGRRSGILADAALVRSDLAHCDACLATLAGLSGRPGSSKHKSARFGSSQEAAQDVVEHCGYSGKDSGEAESIAVCARLDLPLLICDTPGRRLARSQGVDTECAAESLRRLLPTKTTKELFQLYQRMHRAGLDAGAVVTGHLWFRVPEKRS